MKTYHFSNDSKPEKGFGLNSYAKENKSFLLLGNTVNPYNDALLSELELKINKNSVALSESIWGILG